MSIGFRLQKIYLNSIFYLILLVASMVVIPLFTLAMCVLAVFLPHREAMKKFRLFIRTYGLICIKILPWPFIMVIFKDKAQHENHNGPFIYVCNHRSSSDPFLMACLPHELVQVVNVWPFRIPFLGIIARKAGYLSVNEMPFEEFKSKAIQTLHDDVSIAVFPEGTRSESKKMGQFRSAMFRVALATGYPIVPVCISGNEYIPTRDFKLHPGTIRIHKLKSVPWEEYKDMTPYKLKNFIRDKIAQELVYMEGEP
ncbi:MAG: lysophospholipid acyltransferase family protein [Thermodesulfobacteriota bacterium]